ncbi:hypothetical protein XELAEV_18025328mg [Xenopus laevis]|uniref:Secreted protein n=1 Tax=Xenopus laevis TaxID=8355 RepID=A0A974CZ89_XENLA|nr:hypothetical protein XELAEV_18025328mg [Xenopus laevis]
MHLLLLFYSLYFSVFLVLCEYYLAQCPQHLCVTCDTQTSAAVTFFLELLSVTGTIPGSLHTNIEAKWIVYKHLNDSPLH